MQTPAVMLPNAPIDLNAENARQLAHRTKIVGECYRVRVLFDTDARKQDKDYIAVIEDTWLKTFKDTAPELLAEAVQNFIVSDKNGYLPKPGQIVELLVKGVKEIECKRHFRHIEQLERMILLERLQN